MESKFVIPGTKDTIPLVGYGTSYIKDRNILFNCVDAALMAGCRLFDTSASYENEKILGQILLQLMSKYKIKREEIFLTTKMASTDLLTDTIKIVKRSLSNLNSKYIDLYLIEWPGTPHLDPYSPENAVARHACWSRLIDAKQKGFIRYIGVSNFTVKHMEALLENCSGEKPIVNQVEWHPFWHPKDLADLCTQEGILIQAYHSLGADSTQDFLTNKTVIKVAKDLQVTPARVLLRWAVQQGIGVIPSSTNPDHVRDNFDLDFTISPQYLDLLNNMNQRCYIPNLQAIN